MKAHDRIDVNAIRELCAFRKAPAKLMLALLRELGELRIFLPKLFGSYGHGVWVLCGSRQGSPDAGILFAAWIAMKLEKLASSWRSRGFGVMLCRVGGHSEPFWDLEPEILRACDQCRRR